MRGYSIVAVERVQKYGNFDGVMRACHAHNANLIVHGDVYKRGPQDTSSASRHIPTIQCEDILSACPKEATKVVVEITDSARVIETFKHPERGFYIFGPESGSVSSEILAECDDVIYIPTAFSMNLAACVNVVLFHRNLTRGEWPQKI